MNTGLIVTEEDLKEFIEEAEKNRDWDRWWELKLELYKKGMRKELEYWLEQANLIENKKIREETQESIKEMLKRSDKILADTRAKAGVPEKALFDKSTSGAS